MGGPEKVFEKKGKYYGSDDDPLMKNDLENQGREYSDIRGQLIFNMYLIVLNNFNARIGRKRPLPADPKTTGRTMGRKMYYCSA